MTRILKILLGILATIVLGAVGSGLWERVLGPSLDWLTKFTVGLYASVVGTYKDSIYESAARGFHEEHSMVLHTFLIGALPLMYWYLLRRHPTETKDPNDPFRLFMRSRKGYWVIWVLTIAVAFGMMFTALRIRHVNETITYSLASFEIVRPFVGEDKYLQLRSQYFAMRTAAEFHLIHGEVIATAKRHNLRLPAYDPL